MSPKEVTKVDITEDVFKDPTELINNIESNYPLNYTKVIQTYVLEDSRLNLVLERQGTKQAQSKGITMFLEKLHQCSSGKDRKGDHFGDVDGNIIHHRKIQNPLNLTSKRRQLLYLPNLKPNVLYVENLSKFLMNGQVVRYVKPKHIRTTL